MSEHTCSEPGCTGAYAARGLCHTHYRRFLREGGERTMLHNRRYGMTPDERFWSYVKRRSRGCWEWTGYKNEKGYGVINLQGKRVLAHRMSWLLICGEIPDGLFLLHRCDNPACCRISHLFLGTLADNNADMDEKGRARRTGLIMVGKGEANPSAKLTEKDVREIRASSVPGRKLGPKYGVTQVTIDAIRRRAIWSHITDA